MLLPKDILLVKDASNQINKKVPGATNTEDKHCSEDTTPQTSILYHFGAAKRKWNTCFPTGCYFCTFFSHTPYVEGIN